MANKTYSEKLKDPRWQRLRLEVLNRDNFTCRYCGDTKSTLHVHHLYYSKGVEPWEYDDFALMTLCETCHELQHSMTNLEKFLFMCIVNRDKEEAVEFRMRFPHIVKRIKEGGETIY